MSMDHFWYYGQGNVDDETQDDLLCLVVQAKGTLYGWRSYGGNAPAYENRPQGLLTRVGLPHDIASAIADRNRLVSDGSAGYPDRRAYASQATIKVDDSVRGRTAVTVQYIPATDVRTVKTIRAPMGAKQ